MRNFATKERTREKSHPWWGQDGFSKSKEIKAHPYAKEKI